MKSFAFISAAALLASSAQAHFQLLYPPTIVAFNDATEGTGPCGGGTPDFSSQNVTDFHVGGDSIVTQLGHPQSNWLYRITTDQTAKSNWTQLFPIVQQSGLGAFCEPMITVPSSWVGQKAVLSVIANGPDGILYQCANLNLVSGTGSKPSSCSNASSVTGAFASDTTLAALVSGTASSGTPSSTPSSNTSATSATPAATSSKNAAPGMAGAIQGMGQLVVVAMMAVLGAALVL